MTRRSTNAPTTPRRLPTTLASLLAAVLLTACGGRYQGTPNDHFDGAHFFNREPDNSVTDHLRWLWQMETIPWPEEIIDPAQPAPPSRIGAADQLHVTYVNQSTVLIQSAGLNILTDPIWSDRAGPTSWMGARRVRPPGVPFDQLPKIDVVLLSHDHFDHLDRPTLSRLISRDHPQLIAGLGMKPRLADLGATVAELDWWQSTAVAASTLSVTFVPARHNSGRSLFDGNETLWGGFVLELPVGRVLFFGDTAYGEHVARIAERFPGFRLAILPIGNYQPRWFMGTQHMNPDDAIAAHQALHAEDSMAIHFATFEEHPEQSITAHEADLATATASRHVSPASIWLPAFGEGRDFP